MANLDPRRVPAETTEITHTGRGGVQVSIPIRELEDGYLYAEPADANDAAVLDRLGYTTVARKAEASETPEEAPTETRAPRRGGKE